MQFMCGSPPETYAMSLSISGGWFPLDIDKRHGIITVGVVPPRDL